MDGKLAVFLVSMAVVFVAGGVQGNACRDKGFDCGFNMTGVATKIAPLFRNYPPDVDVILAKCRELKELWTGCKNDVLALCPEGFTRNNTLQTMENTYNSACGPNTMCGFKIQDCNLGASDIAAITGVIQQRPPNVQRAKDKCSELNQTLSVCLKELNADCAHLPGMPESISTIRMGLDNLCGQAPLCQIQSASCQSHFAGMGAGPGAQGGGSAMTKERIQKFCQAHTAVKQCMETQLDAECRTLPEMQPFLQGFNASVTPAMCSGQMAECPQLMQCLARREDEVSEDSEDSEDCSWPGTMLGCISGLPDQCQVKEDAITFQELDNTQRKFCQEIKKAGGVDNNCTELGQCVMESELMKTFGGAVGSSGPSEKALSALLDSRTWGGYMNVVAGCYVKSADKCELNSDLLSFMTKQHEHLSSVLSGAKEVMGSSILILMLAVLTAWAHISL